MTLAEPIISRRAKAIEPDELAAMPDAKDFELVDGHLVRRKMGAEPGAVAAELTFLLRLATREKGIAAHIFPSEVGYECFPDAPGKIRKPDVSVVLPGRFPGERVPRGYVTLAPDLVVEVISPNDEVEEIEEKIQEYLRAGVRLIWVAYPSTHRVRVFRQSGLVSDLAATDTLSGEDVLPFSTSVAAIFVGI